MRVDKRDFFRAEVLVLLSGVFLISACGGSTDDSDLVPLNFTITATAGSGGTISPATLSVQQGATASFVVNANEGFIIDAVTGCGGSLAQDGTYTTAAITAACSVTASFLAQSTGDVLTGVFLDAVVENIQFETETQSGQTNSAGEFQYLSGETVTFSLGELVLPSTLAAAVVTPIEILEASGVADDAVVNMVRLLLSLDIDSDGSNGIQLSDAAANVATDAINFFVSIEAFEANAAVLSLIQNGGQNASVMELVSAEDAQLHFEATLQEQGIVLPKLVGAYRETIRAEDEDTSDEVLFVFREDGVYYFMEVNNALSGNDFEFGAFDYQLKRLTANAVLDENEDLGLNGIEEGVLLELTTSGFELIPDDVSAPYVFEKVGVSGEGLVGAWLLQHEDEVVFVFTEDGFFFAMQPMDEEGGIGMEYGTYQHDPSSGLIEFNLILNTSGDTLTSGGAPDSVTVEGDTMMFTVPDEAEPVIFTRIK